MSVWFDIDSDVSITSATSSTAVSETDVASSVMCPMPISERNVVGELI